MSNRKFKYSRGDILVDSLGRKIEILYFDTDYEVLNGTKSYEFYMVRNIGPQSYKAMSAFAGGQYEVLPETLERSYTLVSSKKLSIFKEVWDE